MRSVQREQRTRKLILWAFDLVGALFGLGASVCSLWRRGKRTRGIMAL